MKKVRIDIVSDVVCPWCIIGYKRLEQALTALSDSLKADLYWHPFELNPAMGDQGQNLKEHLQQKYGTTDEASHSARQTLTQLGNEVGFEFHFSPDMRIFNTRQAHQLLMWASSEDKQLELQLKLFQCYFTDNQDISDQQVLMDAATSVGLSPDTAILVLNDKTWADSVATTEQQWLEAGINAVPAIIIDKKHLVSGAQTTDLLISTLKQITAI